MRQTKRFVHFNACNIPYPNWQWHTRENGMVDNTKKEATHDHWMQQKWPEPNKMCLCVWQAWDITISRFESKNEIILCTISWNKYFRWLCWTNLRLLGYCWLEKSDTIKIFGKYIAHCARWWWDPSEWWKQELNKKKSSKMTKKSPVRLLVMNFYRKV